MARPTEYTKDLATYICQQLAEGRSLRSICEEEKMPARSTVYDWLDSNLHGFPDQYARARTRQAETMLDEILEIADDSSQDTTITDFGPKPDTEWISRSKLRVDARKWAMSKLAPKKYGDSKAIDLTSKGQRITGFAITDVDDDDSEA
ncbi:MAG: hypothetical protein EOO63_12425 [Hymenobacter sp.]|nr:MAG: hypothetical protein EOO63_12425 [Hymenobacter sp.]